MISKSAAVASLVCVLLTMPAWPQEYKRNSQGAAEFVDGICHKRELACLAECNVSGYPEEYCVPICERACPGLLKARLMGTAPTVQACHEKQYNESPDTDCANLFRFVAMIERGRAIPGLDSPTFVDPGVARGNYCCKSCVANGSSGDDCKDWNSAETCVARNPYSPPGVSKCFMHCPDGCAQTLVGGKMTCNLDSCSGSD